MGSLWIGVIGTFLLIVFILSGVNVMVALGVVGTVGLAVIIGIEPATTLLSTVFYSTTASFSFSVIPMFLLMGYFAMRAGLGDDLFDTATKWLGNIRGGLAIATTAGAAAFGAASGSSVGSATVFTKLALPEMIRRGYDKRLAAASIAISGTLAVMIPPSALVVVYGILTDSSIGALLIAGVFPGIVFAILICVATYIAVWINPALAPRFKVEATLREKVISLKLTAPLALVILFIIGGLYLGVFTPTEAGGFGALFTLLLAFARHRNIRGLALGPTLLDTIQTTAMIFAIIICALIFSKFLALSGVTSEIGAYFKTAGLSRWMVVFLITILYLIMGMLMDAPAMLAISLPITHPVMLSLGFDPVWFGCYVVLLAEIGAVTPPVGVNCFVVQSASDGLVTLEQVFAGLIPYILAGFAMLFILCVFPELALFLPKSMMG
jgi:tripartite ATP-independent transporter DctM subunit